MRIAELPSGVLESGMSQNMMRENLVGAINEMACLLEVCVDIDQRYDLRIKIRQLFQRMDRVIVASLDEHSLEFGAAIKSLAMLSEDARKAKDDLNRIAGTLNKASDAIGKLEKIVKNIDGVTAIL